MSLFYSTIKSTSVRPYLLIFEPGRALYCPESLSPSSLLEAAFSPSFQSQLRGPFSGEEEGGQKSMVSQYQEKDGSTSNYFSLYKICPRMLENLCDLLKNGYIFHIRTYAHMLYIYVCGNHVYNILKKI